MLSSTKCARFFMTNACKVQWRRTGSHSRHMSTDTVVNKVKWRRSCCYENRYLHGKHNRLMSTGKFVTEEAKYVASKNKVKLRRRQTKLSEVVVMSVVGVVSGYYIFNDIFKQVSDEESGDASEVQEGVKTSSAESGDKQ